MTDYWDECPHGSCEVRFIGATKDDMLEHVRGEHGGWAAFGAQLLVTDVDCPECGEYKIRPEDDRCTFCKKEAKA